MTRAWFRRAGCLRHARASGALVLFLVILWIGSSGLLQGQAETAQEGTSDRLTAHLPVSSRLDTLDDAQKRRLKEQWERFRRLPAQEQERLRALHRQIEQHPEREVLESVMHRYYEWFTKLSRSERRELTALPPAARLERIEELRLADQYRLASDAVPLSEADHRALFRWSQRLARSVGLGLRELVGEQGAAVTPEQLDELTQQLSERPRQLLEDAPNTTARQKLVADWIGTMFSRPRPPSFENRQLLEMLDEESPDVVMRWAEMPRGAAEREMWRRMQQRRGMRGRGGRGPGGPVGFGERFDAPRSDDRPGAEGRRGGRPGPWRDDGGDRGWGRGGRG